MNLFEQSSVLPVCSELQVSSSHADWVTRRLFLLVRRRWRCWKSMWGRKLSRSTSSVSTPDLQNKTNSNMKASGLLTHLHAHHMGTKKKINDKICLNGAFVFFFLKPTSLEEKQCFHCFLQQRSYKTANVFVNVIAKLFTCNSQGSTAKWQYNLTLQFLIKSFPFWGPSTPPVFSGSWTCSFWRFTLTKWKLDDLLINFLVWWLRTDTSKYHRILFIPFIFDV